MTLNITNKRSSVQDSAPTASQLEFGEIGVNYNQNSVALYIKDNSGTIRKLAEGDATPSYWQLVGNDLSPLLDAYSVRIGGGDILLNANGSGAFAGKVTSAETVAGDANETLVTKGYVDAAIPTDFGVTKLTAGANISLNPAGGVGDVEITANFTAPVTSVNGQTGDVVLDAADVGALAPGDNVSELTNDAGYITNAGVTKLTAGTGISLNPADGLGSVEITATGGGGGSVDSVSGGTNISISGTAADPVVDLDDSIALTGKATSAETISADPDNTLVTKGYVDTAIPTAAVTRIIAGTNVTIDPTGGTGEVTINSAGGSGGVTSIIAGEGISIDQPTGNVTITNTGGGGGTPVATTNVIQSRVFTEPSVVTVTATTMVNAQNSAFNYTPASDDSKIIVQYNFNGSISNLAGVNAQVNWQLASNGVAITNQHVQAAFDASGGIGVTGPYSVYGVINNTSLNPLAITIQGAVGPNQTATITNKTCTITEIVQDRIIAGGGGGGSTVAVSDAPPVNPSQGDQWWDSSDGGGSNGGRMYLYYDGNWVQTSNVGLINPTPTNSLGVAKAWVLYNGLTGEILSSFGIDAVTNIGSSIIKITFEEPFANTNYCAIGGALPLDLGNAPYVMQEYTNDAPRTASDIHFYANQSASAYNSSKFQIAFFSQ